MKATDHEGAQSPTDRCLGSSLLLLPPLRRFGVLAVSMVAATLIVPGCASDDEAICYSNDVASLCASSSDGRIAFSGTGLEPGSEVRVVSDEFEPTDFAVGEDGTFEESESSGFLSGVNTRLVFSVAGVDSTGAPLMGDITVET